MRKRVEPRRAARRCGKDHSRKRKCVGEGTAWKEFRKERIQETVGEARVLGPVALGTNKAWISTPQKRPPASSLGPCHRALISQVPWAVMAGGSVDTA